MRLLLAAMFLCACDPSPDRAPDAGDSSPDPQCVDLGGTCASRGDCCGEHVGCFDSKCTALKPLGDPCANNDQCESTVCDTDATCCHDPFLTPSSSCSGDGDCCFGGKCHSGECCWPAGLVAFVCVGGHDPNCCSGNCSDLTGNCL